MTKANAQQRALFGRAGLDQFKRDSRLIGRAGAGRDEEPFGPAGHGLTHRNVVVARHFHRDAHFLEVVDEIPGEAVVIVDDQDHGMRLNLSMDRAPASLLTIACFGGARDGFRSEEHTSELQSLMRISYAVFCLKKKNNTTNVKNTQIKNI